MDGVISFCMMVSHKGKNQNRDGYGAAILHEGKNQSRGSHRVVEVGLNCSQCDCSITSSLTTSHWSLIMEECKIESSE